MLALQATVCLVVGGPVVVGAACLIEHAATAATARRRPRVIDGVAEGWLDPFPATDHGRTGAAA